MEIITSNAEMEFHTILDSITLSPLAWEQWSCLHIRAIELEHARINPDILAYATAILDYTLEDMDGKTFFCGYEDLYIVVKHISSETLHLAGQYICDALSLNRRDIMMKTYDLAHDNIEFVYSVCGNRKSFMSAYAVQDIPEQILQKPKTPKKQFFLPKVLLVEDDPSTRWMVRTLLKERCELATAPDVAKGITRFLTFQPDLVFLDINLPDGNGLTVLEWVKRNQKRTDVVMFSGQDSMDNISMALDGGAKGFIPKPFSKEKVLQYVQECRV